MKTIMCIAVALVLSISLMSADTANAKGGARPGGGAKVGGRPGGGAKVAGNHGAKVGGNHGAKIGGNHGAKVGGNHGVKTAHNGNKGNQMHNGQKQNGNYKNGNNNGKNHGPLNRNYRGWTSVSFLAGFGAYAYYSPDMGAWYYWYEPSEMYLPVDVIEEFPPVPDKSNPPVVLPNN
jgi:hypothetical protein